MAKRLQIRRDTAEAWASVNPVLLEGELGLVVSGGKIAAFKVGNGVSAWSGLPLYEMVRDGALDALEEAIAANASAIAGKADPGAYDAIISELSADVNHNFEEIGRLETAIAEKEAGLRNEIESTHTVAENAQKTATNAYDIADAAKKQGDELSGNYDILFEDVRAVEGRATTLEGKVSYLEEESEEMQSDLTLTKAAVELLNATKANAADVYELLKAYAKVGDVPTKVSELANDAGYITLADVPSVEGYLKVGAALGTGLDWQGNLLRVIPEISDGAKHGATAYGWGDHRAAGYLTQSSLSGYAKSSDLDSYLKKTSLSFGTGLNDDNFSVAVNTDVIATKSWVEGKNYLTSVSKAQVTTALGFTPQQIISAGDGIAFSSNVVSVDSTIARTSDLSGYLSKSVGGTITSSSPEALVINRTGGNPPYLTFNSDGLTLGRIGYDVTSKELIASIKGAFQTLIHSGNIGSYNAGGLSSKTPQLAAKTESNEITIVDNANSAITTNKPSSTLSSIRKAIDFKWFGEHWQIGAIRGDGEWTEGFGITEGNNILRFRVKGENAWIGSNAIIHSGNYSKYIDFGDGIAFSSNIASINTDWLKSTVGVYTMYKNEDYTTYKLNTFGLVNNAGPYITFGSSDKYQTILRTTGSETLQVKKIFETTDSGWKTVAFTDSTVAAANKLSTARTLWGQSFDGSGDVDGSIVMKNDSSIAIKNTSGSTISLFHFTSSNALYLGYGAAANSYNTLIDGNTIYLRYGAKHSNGLILNSSGNVGIGTTDPQYKLDVNGQSAFHARIRLHDGAAISYHDGESNTERLILHAVPAYNYDLCVYNPNYGNWKRVLHEGNISAYLGTGLVWLTSQKVLAIDYTESDPVFTASAAYSITNTNKSNWTTAYNNWSNGVSNLKVDKIICKSNNNIAVAMGSIEIGSGVGNGYSFYADSSSYVYLGAENHSWYGVYAYSFNNVSDATKKDVLGNVELKVNDIANAPAKVFTWKDLPDKRRKVGTIAQYWQNVLPEVVSGSEGSLSMNYAELAVVSSIVIARSVETHAQRIERLEQEIATMQEELKILKGVGGE